MRAPGWGRLPAGCVLGVLALGAVGVPAPVGPYAASTAAAERRADAPQVSLTAQDAVLQVRADGPSTTRIVLPGTVVGAAPATPAASVVPPGLAGPPGPTGPLGVPDRVLAAYRFAQEELARTHPGCALPWWLLAGIGRVESGHASGGRVDAEGRTRGEVLGPLLDGSLTGTMVVPDTDGGVLDGDPEFDRAVGPMQFLPGTWDMVGTDADRDRTADPHDVDDAATTAGVYLCRGGGSMLEPEQLRAAVLRYNGSEAYVDAVLSWGTSYRDRAVAVPGEAGSIAPAPVPTAVPTLPVTTAPATAPTARPTSRPTTSPTGTPEPPPTGPTTAPTTSPTAAPSTEPTTGTAPSPTGSTPVPVPEPTGTGPLP